MLETVQNAILAAYRKDHPGVEVDEYKASLDPNTGEAKIFNGDENVTPPGFGRIAAQTAKQVILQKIREKEKEAIFTDYRDKIGGIVNGMVLRFAGPNVIIDIGKAEAIMPVSEQIPNEKYHLNQRLAFYLSEIREGMKGEEIVVSRAHNGLIQGLFKREVPEVAQGSVEIKSIVREPGNRAKIAVFSQQPGIDPVGSCVGQKGVRVQAIIQELGGLEKIDIIQWSDDPKTYIAQALSPAKKVRVELDEKEKIAHVFVPQDELSLAIGKDGQNVRLAYKLTQYRIEIEGEGGPTVSEEEKEAPAVEAAAPAKVAEAAPDPILANQAENEPAETVSEEKENVVPADDSGVNPEPILDVSEDVEQVSPDASTTDELASTQAAEESTPDAPAQDSAQNSEVAVDAQAQAEEPTEEDVESTPDVSPEEQVPAEGTEEK